MTTICGCGNVLTEKEIFYNTCLKCGETVGKSMVEIKVSKKKVDWEYIGIYAAMLLFALWWLLAMTIKL